MPPFRRNCFCDFCPLGFIFLFKNWTSPICLLQKLQNWRPPLFLKHSKNQSPLLEKLRGRQGRGASGRQGRGSSGRRFRFFILFGIFLLKRRPFLQLHCSGVFFETKISGPARRVQLQRLHPPRPPSIFLHFPPSAFRVFESCPGMVFFEFWVWKPLPHPFSPPCEVKPPL